MANYNNLKTAIQAVIKANGNQEITGDILQNALLSTINSLGEGYQFIGVATPATNPGTPDQKVFYVANGKGTYNNFGGIEVTEDEVVFLYWDSSWHKVSTGIASQWKLTELKEKVDALALGAFYGYFPDSSSLPVDVTTPGYAYVGLDNPYKIWNFNGESWSDSGTSIDMNDADEEDITRNADGKLQFKDRAYGDGMGYVILRKDKTFAEQVTQVNTIYEIRYDFTLSSNVVIPPECVIFFNGGSIIGTKKITFDNTELVGNPIILSDYDGELSNTNVNIAWFGIKENNVSFNNAPIIAKVLNTFHRGVLIGLDVYFSTPINIDGFDGTDTKSSLISLDCNLHFNGANNVGDIISFSNIYDTRLFIKSLDNASDSTNNNGLRFNGAKRNNIEIISILGFSTNVLIKPINNDGFAQNRISIKESSAYKVNCNCLVLDATNGWINDNYFSDCYFSKVSASADITVIGVTIISGTYRPNTNIFNKTSFEWNTKCIVFDGGIQNYFNRARTENCANIVTAIGKPGENYVDITYYSNSSLPLVSYIDDSGVSSGYLWGTLIFPEQIGTERRNNLIKSISTLAQRTENIRENGYAYCRISNYLFRNSLTHNPTQYYDDVFVPYARLNVNDICQMGYGDYLGIEISSMMAKKFLVYAETHLGEDARYSICYTKRNGEQIKTNQGLTPPKIGKNVLYDSNFDLFYLGALAAPFVVDIPSDIEQFVVLVKCVNEEGDAIKVFDVSAINHTSERISYDLKPTMARTNINFAPIGFSIIEDGKPLWWNGTAWVNADGTVVS